MRESGRLFRNAGQPGLSLLLVLLCLVMPAWAQAASAHLELDSRQLRVGQTATLRLVLTDGTARDVPHVPASEQLRISYQGQSQSYVSVNFRTTRMVTYQYAVTALQPGPAWVGPVEVELKDGRARAAILALSVEERDAVDPGAAQLQASLRTGVEQVQQPQEVWQGQTVVYELRFSHRDRVYDARWTQPDFEGFATEPTAEQTQREYRLQDAGGSVQVHEIHVPLVVTSVGKREPPGGSHGPVPRPAAEVSPAAQRLRRHLGQWALAGHPQRGPEQRRYRAAGAAPSAAGATVRLRRVGGQLSRHGRTEREAGGAG